MCQASNWALAKALVQVLQKSGSQTVVLRFTSLSERQLPLTKSKKRKKYREQVEYQGQTQNTRILERKPLIDTSYRIGHGLELKYFHLAQFLLNSH